MSTVWFGTFKQHAQERLVLGCLSGL